MTEGASNPGTPNLNSIANSPATVLRRTGPCRKALSVITFPRLTIIGALLAVAVLLIVITAPANAAVAPPSGFTATAGDSQVTLSWDDPFDSTITGYQVLQVAIDKLDDPSKAGSEPVSIGAGDRFGDSVGIAGNRAVVGAPLQESLDNQNTSITNGGWGHTFSRGSGGWSYDEFLAVSNPQVEGRLGSSVAVAGSTAIVGAPSYHQNNNTDPGEITIASKSSQTNSWDTEFTATGQLGNDLFGTSVALDTGVAVVGAPGALVGTDALAGKVYLYTKSSGVWGLAAVWYAGSNAGASHIFGTSVAVDGSTVVVGSPGEDTSKGAAYVFTKNNNVWSLAARLTAYDGANLDSFGKSVAIHDDTIVVGAWGDDDGAGQTGSAYVFTKPQAGWSDMTQTAKLTASDAAQDDHFGWSVAVNGDNVVVGAYGNDDDGTDSGSVYLFTKPSGSWVDATETVKLTAPDGAVDDNFGDSVAAGGGRVIVGAPGDESETGAAYVFSIPTWSNISNSDKNTTSHTVTGLDNDVEYTFLIRPVDSGGPGPASVIKHAKPQQASAATPTNLTAAAGVGEVTLSWDDPNDSTITAYKYRQKEAGGSFGQWTTIPDSAYGEANTTGYTVRNLTNGQTYTFRLRAEDEDGDTANSGDVTVTTILAAPTNLTATVSVGAGQIALDWDNPNNTLITKYQYSTNGGTSFTDIPGSDANTTEYTVTGLGNGTEYTLAVRAVNASVNGEAATVTATTRLPLVPLYVSNIGQPTDTSVGADADLSSDQAQQFSTGTDGAGYVLGSIDVYFQRGTDSEDLTVTVWNSNTNADPGSTVHTLTNPDTIEPGLVRFTAPAQLAANTNYFVHVAFSGSGTPPRLRTTTSTNEDAGAAANWSITNYRHQADSSSATGWAYQSNLLKISVNDVLDLPAAPGNFEATGGDGQVVLSWDDPQDDYITKYQYSTDGGTNYNNIALTAIDSSETGKFKYTVANLSNGTTHTFDVRAVNSAGDGAVSTKTVVMMPTAPTGFTAMPRDQRVELSWDDPGNTTITKYQYSTDGGTNFADIPASDASTTSYNVTVLSDGAETALANATMYTLAVRAVNPSGAGPASTGTATPMPAPAAPSGLSATPGDGRVTLSWTDPGDASITKYQYSTDYMIGGGNSNNGVETFNDIELTALDSTSDPGFIKYTVTGLANGVTYTLALRAVNPSGEGAVSTATAVMVPAAPKLSAAPGDGQVVLSWDDPANPTIGKYQLSQSDPPEWSKITGSNATTTTHPVTGLTNYTGYSFQIRAVNETGAGPASNSASATPRLPKPAKPTELTAEAGDKKVTLSWQDPNDSTIDVYQLSEVVPEDWLTASVGLGGDHFGISVAIDGNTAVVGADRANSKKGSVRIFTRDPNGLWTQQAKLEGENTGDQFGWSVAVEGDTVVVGAHAYDGEDTNGTTLENSGAAYIFTRTGGVWSQAAKLAPTVPEEYAFFGGSVALAGNTLAIGSRLYDAEDFLGSGAAYVFTKSGTTWSQQAKLTASIPRQLAYLGYSLAVDGDTVLAGAYGDDTVFGELGSGSAYVFDKPPGGWTDGNETAKLTASDRQPSGYFGFSVALDGDTAVIGARQHNDPITGAGSGAAYVFARESGVWGEKAKLTPSDAAAGDNFGMSVAVEDDTVVVGSWQDDDNGRNSGSAYVFTKPALGWAGTLETLKLTAPDGAANDRFGWSVGVDLDAVRGDLALVGAYSDDIATGMDAGSVHVLGIPDWKDIDLSDDATISHNVTKELDDPEADLSNGTPYDFQIRAMNESGYGPASDGVSATPMGVPETPADLSADAGDTQVTLNWTAAADNDTIAPITKYQYQYQVEQSGGTFGDWTNWADIPGSGPTTTEYTKTGLENKAHKFRVRAVNVIGEGPSATKDATPASATPAAPDLSATAGDTQVKLEWADPNDSSIDKYQYSTDGGTVFIDIDPDDIDYSVANTIGYTVISLTNGTEYTFHIRAVDNQALQPYGDASDVKATPTGTLPDSPLNLEAEPGHEEVRLSWDDPDDASIDKYHYSIDGVTNSTTISADATTYTITGLTNGTTYTFQIWAENAAGVGPASAAIDAKPLPPQLLRPTLEPPEEGNGEVKLKWAYTHVETKETILRYEVLHLLKTSKLTGVGGDKFGYAVAVDGDIAVIGAFQDDDNGVDSGAVYVFSRVEGVWTQAAKLTALDGEAYDNFGISVAVDGDTVVVGAPGNDGAGADSGAAYVFTRNDGAWDDRVKLTASDGAALDYFGYSVAVDGDTVLVGAYRDDDEENDSEDSGSAYIFTKPNSSGGWADWDPMADTETAKLTASDGADDDWFGVSVALDGNTAVIGASGDDDKGIDSGSVYVFVKPPGAWADGNETDKRTADDGEAQDNFGYSVAVDVDTVEVSGAEVEVATVVVGAYQHDPIDPDSDPDSTLYLLDAGAAYVFTRDSGGVWDEGERLTADDGDALDYFGYSVAVDVDTVVVGAYEDDDNDSASGSAYVFTRDSNGEWSQKKKLTDEDGEAGDWFGYSVAVDSAAHTALVGAGSAHVLDIHDWESVPGITGQLPTEHTVENLFNGREYDFQVRAVNLRSAGPQAESEAIPQANINPVFENESVTFDVPENTAAGSNVGSVAAYDPNGDDLNYSKSGNGAAYFDIGLNSGAITVGLGTGLDYESGPTSYNFTVYVTDGMDSDGNPDNNVSDDSIAVTINVTKVDEGGGGSGGGPGTNGGPDNNPPAFSDGDSTARTVPENVVVGTEVGGPVGASDPDNDPLEYSLLGTDQGAFAVDLRNGQLTTKTPLDYEVKNEYSVRVKVRDGRGGVDDINVTINVTDVDEPPAPAGAPEVSSAGPTGLTVGWTAPDNQGPEITGYDVRYRDAGGAFRDAAYSGIGTSMTLQGLTPGSSYEVQVRAINDEGTSPWSESGRGETEEVSPPPVPTPSPDMTTTPTPSPTPDATPDATPELAPTAAATATAEPSATSTPAPVLTPDPTQTPVPTSIVEPVAAPTTELRAASTISLDPETTPEPGPTGSPTPGRTPTAETEQSAAAVTPSPASTPPAPAPTPTTEPMPSEADGGGFPWWFIVAAAVLIFVGIILIVWGRRNRR